VRFGSAVTDGIGCVGYGAVWQSGKDAVRTVYVRHGVVRYGRKCAKARWGSDACGVFRHERSRYESNNG
jgi:hypothetical protein